MKLYNDSFELIGTYTSELNYDEGEGVVFAFNGATFSSQLVVFAQFNSPLPDLGCGGNSTIYIKLNASTWNADYDSGYYVLNDTPSATQLVSITIDVC